MVQSRNPSAISTIEDELADANRRGGGRGKLRDSLIGQSKLPKNHPVIFRVIPHREGVKIPWTKCMAHTIAVPESLQVEGKWKFLTVVCSGDNCPVCNDFIPGVEAAGRRAGTSARMKKVYEDWATSMKAKVKGYMLVVFQQFGREAVPTGVRIFEFGGGIWKGNARNEIGGLLKIAQEQPDFHSLTDGVAISILKTGEKLDTNYKVTLDTVQTAVPIAGSNRTVMTAVPNICPISEDLDALAEYTSYNELPDIELLTAVRPVADTVKILREVDVLDVLSGELSRATARAMSSSPAGGAKRNSSPSGEIGGDDDIPF